MARYILLAAIAFACLGIADTRAAVLIDGTLSAEGFVFRRGLWWRGSNAYTRAPAYNYGRAVRYVYRRAPAVIVNNKIITAASPNWQTELAKAKAQSLDNQAFIAALGELGPSYAQSRVQSYSYGGGVGYTQNSIASIYGDTSPSLLYQQAARQTENAQGLAGDAHAAFANLVGLDAAGRARAAELIAAGQAIAQARAGGVSVSVQSGAQSLPGAPSPTPPVPQMDPKAISGQPAFGKCAACHSQATAAKGKGFVLIAANGQPRTLNALELLKLSGRVRDSSMPPAGSPALTDDEAETFIDWISQRANELK